MEQKPGLLRQICCAKYSRVRSRGDRWPSQRASVTFNAGGCGCGAAGRCGALWAGSACKLGCQVWLGHGRRSLSRRRSASAAVAWPQFVPAKAVIALALPPMRERRPPDVKESDGWVALRHNDSLFSIVF